jgi:hypothetical protein
MRGKQRIDSGQQSVLAERPGKHGGDDFRRIWNFEGRQWVSGDVENAHFRATLSQIKREIGPRHSGGMQRGN